MEEKWGEIGVKAGELNERKMKETMRVEERKSEREGECKRDTPENKRSRK